MIPVNEAIRIIKDHAFSPAPVKQLLNDAAGMVLAADVIASVSIPSYPQSAMDGYAIKFQDLQHKKELAINGEIPAGANAQETLLPGQAMRIFTGAALPPGADTVVMQEKVQVNQQMLTVQDDALQQGSNVRAAGSEIEAGTKALPGGSMLNPAAVGFLAGIGVHEVTVFPDPVVSIIITGNELQAPGNPLQYGKVYESNGAALKAALQQCNIPVLNIIKAPDDLQQLSVIMATAMEESDIVLLTGGVSVGNYDFVLPAAAANAVHTLFHKVKQRPGKPLFVGKKNDVMLFGLPGNPASVLSCFYIYVLQALEIFCHRRLSLQTLECPLKEAFHKKNNMTQFLKGWYDGETVTVLDAQESYRMRSFAIANCLLKLEEDTGFCEAGMLVEIHLLPQ